MADEISAKLNTACEFAFGDLMASDVLGRANAFKSLTAGGMTVEQAKEICRI